MRSFLASVGLAIVLLATQLAGQQPPVFTPFGAIPVLDAYLESLRQQMAIPGMRRAAVVRDGSIIWERGDGSRTSQPASARHRIHRTVGDISGTLAATMLLECAEQRRLELDQPGRRYGVELPSPARRCARSYVTPLRRGRAIRLQSRTLHALDQRGRAMRIGTVPKERGGAARPDGDGARCLAPSCGIRTPSCATASSTPTMSRATGVCSIGWHCPTRSTAAAAPNAPTAAVSDQRGRWDHLDCARPGAAGRGTRSAALLRQETLDAAWNPVFRRGVVVPMGSAGSSRTIAASAWSGIRPDHQRILLLIVKLPERKLTSSCSPTAIGSAALSVGPPGMSRGPSSRRCF